MRNLLIVLAFLVVPSFVYSADEIHGDWKVSVHKDTQMTDTFTANNSGSVFGMICIAANDSCLFYVSPQTTCEDEAISNVLINSDAGALSTEIKCMKLGDTYYSIIKETSAVQEAVMKSKNIGIAFPMENGQFKVVRFSLVGANAAIISATEKAAIMVKTSDQLL